MQYRIHAAESTRGISMTSLIISAEGSVLHAWLKPSSRAAEQPSSRAAEQPSSRAAEQPSSRAAESDNSPRSSFLLEFTVLVFPAVVHAIRSGTSPLQYSPRKYCPGRCDQQNTISPMMHDDDIDGGPDSTGASASSGQDSGRGTDPQSGMNEGQGADGAAASSGRSPLSGAGNASRLLVPTADGSIYLPYEGIVRLQADGSYTHIHTDKGERLMTCKGIGVLHEQLPMEWFHRCHRTHVINLIKVRKLIRIGGHRVELLTGDLVEVSRRNWQELVQAMGSLRS